MNIKAIVRTKIKTDKAKIRFRVYQGKTEMSLKTEISINPEYWDSKKGTIKAKVTMHPLEKANIVLELRNWRDWIERAYSYMHDKGIMYTSENLAYEVDKLRSPGKYTNDNYSNFFTLYDKWSNEAKVSRHRKQAYATTRGCLFRFERYCKDKDNTFLLSLDRLTPDVLIAFEAFLFDECEICSNYPDWYLDEKIEPRGQNTISGILKILRAFVNWSIKNEHTSNYAFKKFKIPEELYGTPYFLTIEERNKLHELDLSYKPSLAIQRDIFIFQSLICCRVSDLLRLNKNSVVNDAIEYLAIKTIDKKPVTIRVPLTTTAKEIIEKYKDIEGEKLLPFISEQKYNLAIKEAFKEAKLDRIVTILDPLTRTPVQKPLHEIASSHLARRTFIGNLYNKVKDPDLISSLSGHAEGSRAFKRYRVIEENVKKELIDLLE